MAWARLDDRWHDHPKVIAAGLDGAGLFAMCLTWAHSVRRTSPTPGVVPDAVISRFAGRKAAQLTSRLRSVGLFDDRTEAGWPIHDFADYLPRYDTEQARAAGSRGGRARAANRKQTAKQTASQPLGGTEADYVAKASTRASARRNPVPVPSEVLRTSGDADAPPAGASGPEPTAQTLLAGWIDLCDDVMPDSRVKGHLASEIKRLLGEGIPAESIRDGIRIWHGRRLNPAALASVVHGVRLGPPEPGLDSPAAQRASQALAAGASVQARLEAQQQLLPAAELPQGA